MKTVNSLNEFISSFEDVFTELSFDCELLVRCGLQTISVIVNEKTLLVGHFDAYLITTAQVYLLSHLHSVNAIKFI